MYHQSADAHSLSIDMSHIQNMYTQNSADSTSNQANIIQLSDLKSMDALNSEDEKQFQLVIDSNNNKNSNNSPTVSI